MRTPLIVVTISPTSLPNVRRLLYDLRFSVSRNHNYRMANLDEVKMVWRLADAVCFDVDSTVIQEEGIDELAKFCGKGDQVASL